MIKTRKWEKYSILQNSLQTVIYGFWTSFRYDFCSGLRKLGNKPDKHDLDEDKSIVDKYWDRVREAYLIEDKYRELVQKDEWFNYDSKHVILTHESTKLKECGMN